MVNIFNSPTQYLKELYRNQVFTQDRIDTMISEFKGLSMMCVWITKLCPLQCEKCFFRSNMNHDGLKREEYEFTDEGITKLVAFINSSNSGYLMLSGGGDPMVCPDHVSRLISETKTKRIVIVTSGFWAKNYETAENYIGRLYSAYIKRKYNDNCNVVIRLSVDQYHEDELGDNTAYKNIVQIFAQNYSNIEGFSLLIHTMRDDTSVYRLTADLEGELTYGEEGESDNNAVIKIVPKKAYITVGSFTIPVGISKLFLSDLMIDLNPPYSQSVIDAVKVMTDDMENSEQGNPSYIQNSLGRKGLDFWVDYNGNVTTWFNQDWYHLFNLYTDDYSTLVSETFSNPMTAFFLKKGYEYRNKIVAEVNPLALLRAQSINLRDYFVAFLLEEDNTKLYYGIRSIQSFLNEYFITESDLEQFSDDLQSAIKLPIAELKKLYDESDFDILDQYMIEDRFNRQKWEDLFLLIALGQYKVSPEHLAEKISFYCRKTGECKKNVRDFLVPYNQELYSRLHKRISFMKTEALWSLYKNPGG